MLKDYVSKDAKSFIFRGVRGNVRRVKTCKVKIESFNNHEKGLFLARLYLSEKQSISFISNIFECDEQTITNYLESARLLNNQNNLKLCSECLVITTLDNYYTDTSKKDNLSVKCKSCIQKYKDDNREIINQKAKAYSQKHKNEKSEYFRNVFYPQNRVRLISNRKKWGEANMDHIKKYRETYYEENRDYILAKAKTYYDPETKREYNCKYRTEINPGKCAADRAARRAAILNATPPWTNLKEIKQIYQTAREQQNIDGIIRHVDHIIPLRSKLVCGLHIPSNLQIIPAKDNLEKSNKFKPIILSEQRL